MAEDFAALQRLASEGHLADLVEGLLRGLREGGQKVLEAQLRALEEVRVDGEVVTVAFSRDVAAAIVGDSATRTAEGLQLASACGKLGARQQEALLRFDGVKTVLEAMTTFKDDGDVQLLGMAAMSHIIGRHTQGLRQFVSHHGLSHVEGMMQRHPQNLKLQLRAIAQVASVAEWRDGPPDGAALQRSAKFCPQRAIALVKQAMRLHPGSAEIQLAGMKALSAIVGQSRENLFAFASSGGLEICEQAMLRHPENAGVQEKCIRILTGGGKWSPAERERVGYCPERALALVKQAMVLHLDNEQLQVTAVEQMERHFSRDHLEIVARCGGVELLRTSMSRHQSMKLRKCCKKLLEAMGETCPELAAAEGGAAKGGSRQGPCELELGKTV